MSLLLMLVGASGGAPAVPAILGDAVMETSSTTAMETSGPHAAMTTTSSTSSMETEP